MKLRELYSELNRLISEGHGEKEIFVSSDAEGNRINEFDEITTGLFTIEGEGVHPQDIEDGEVDADEVTERLVIWPR